MTGGWPVQLHIYVRDLGMCYLSATSLLARIYGRRRRERDKGVNMAVTDLF